MTLSQEIITIGMVVLGTALTRYLPFLLFPAGKIGRMCVALVLYRGFAELLLWKNSPGGL